MKCLIKFLMFISTAGKISRILQWTLFTFWWKDNCQMNQQWNKLYTTIIVLYFKTTSWTNRRTVSTRLNTKHLGVSLHIFSCGGFLLTKILSAYCIKIIHQLIIWIRIIVGVTFQSVLTLKKTTDSTVERTNKGKWDQEYLLTKRWCAPTGSGLIRGLKSVLTTERTQYTCYHTYTHLKRYMVFCHMLLTSCCHHLKGHMSWNSDSHLSPNCCNKIIYFNNLIYPPYCFVLLNNLYCNYTVIHNVCRTIPYRKSLWNTCEQIRTIQPYFANPHGVI